MFSSSLIHSTELVSSCGVLVYTGKKQEVGKRLFSFVCSVSALSVFPLMGNVGTDREVEMDERLV